VRVRAVHMRGAQWRDESAVRWWSHWGGGRVVSRLDGGAVGPVEWEASPRWGGGTSIDGRVVVGAAWGRHGAVSSECRRRLAKREERGPTLRERKPTNRVSDTPEKIGRERDTQNPAARGAWTARGNDERMDCD
jgi:hypothetical protein